MLVRFADAAEALRSITRDEQHRLYMTELLASQGRMVRPDDIEISTWRRRTALLQKSAELITILAPHEEAVRALDPLLAR
jgi:hypothetical protein